MMDKNNCTVGDTYTASVMCDGIQHTVNFYVTTRAGATEGMITSTLRHFISAIRSVANGDIACADGYDKSTEWLPSPIGEARVSLWVKSPGIPALLEKGTRFIQVNVFTEDCTAQNFITLVNEHINTMDVITASGAVELANGIKQQTAPPQQPKPQSELDKHFGEREEAPPQSPQDTSIAPPSTPGQPVLIDYDYKLNEQYEQDFVGRLVEVKVERIARLVKAKKDGTGSYEMIFVFQKSHYESPIFNLNMFPMKPGDTFGSGKELDRIMPGVFVEPGDSVEGEFGLIYKISKSKDGRVFWNLKDVKIYQSHTPQPEEAMPSGDEIPF